jgi:hypothetical protein
MSLSCNLHGSKAASPRQLRPASVRACMQSTRTASSGEVLAALPGWDNAGCHGAVAEKQPVR